ncbi:MAG: hypothetical protein DI529_14415, partial [Chryseobacterium sp.]
MKHWIQAARLRTLPLSLSGIIMGAFIAKWRLSQEGGIWDWRIFALALLVTLLYQILSNFANDYGDGDEGDDDGASFDREVSIDVSALHPMVTWGNSPEDALPIDACVPDPAAAAA